jgi:hypothetical protein
MMRFCHKQKYRRQKIMTAVKKDNQISDGENPEAIAKFAQSARSESTEASRTGINSTPETSPLPADPALKQKAANAVLRENVLGDDEGSEELIKELPDPILDHHKL